MYSQIKRDFSIIILPSLYFFNLCIDGLYQQFIHTVGIAALDDQLVAELVQIEHQPPPLRFIKIQVTLFHSPPLSFEGDVSALLP